MIGCGEIGSEMTLTTYRSFGPSRERNGRGRCSFVAPLLFARNSVVVAIHLDVGAVFQEKRGFSTRGHLRAQSSTIALEDCRGGLLNGLSCDGQSRSSTVRILDITVGDQGNDNGKLNKTPESTSFFAAIWGRVLPGGVLDLTIQAHKIRCAFPSIFVVFHLKREPFTNSGALSIFRKRRNVNEYLGTALSGGDKPKTPIIVPFCESAFYAHMKGLTKL